MSKEDAVVAESADEVVDPELDFDEIIAEELEQVEPKYKVFRYKGRVWHAAPRIGVGTVRKLLRAEKRGDHLATIGFLESIVIEPEWEDIVDRMPPDHAGKIVNKLLQQYGGDEDSGK